jgi:hypothetical protein
MVSKTIEKPGFFNAHSAKNPSDPGSPLGMDDLAVNYIRTRAQAAHLSVGQVINELVRKEMWHQLRGEQC